VQRDVTRVQVGIIGAGPAGLMLSHLLHLEGIESVVLEDRSREYVEQRVRAGVLEHGTAELFDATGLGARMRAEGLLHRGIELRFARRPHRVDFEELTNGRSIVVYGQQEVVKDLIAARQAAGGDIRFEVSDVRIGDLEGGDRPTIHFRGEGREETLNCDAVVGCDGSHGISRNSFVASDVQVFEHDHPFAWLGILAAVAPSTEELIYSRHERGFALHSVRTPEISRLYLQVAPNERLHEWPDDRIWDELSRRFATDDGWTLREGPVIEKGITPMRSYVHEPMRRGRLFLAGDAAHIVPPTGAKGLNLAIADVRDLAPALATWLRSGDDRFVDAYEARALRRAWRAQEFSTYMTMMLHPIPGDDFHNRLALSRLDYVATSRSAAASLAENYVDLARL
jgi:p-hydroxybenzoate 3-monooxygenase